MANASRRLATDHLIGVQANDGNWSISVRSISGVRVRHRGNGMFKDMSIHMHNGETVRILEQEEAERVMTNLAKCFTHIGGSVFHDPLQ